MRALCLVSRKSLPFDETFLCVHGPPEATSMGLQKGQATQVMGSRGPLPHKVHSWARAFPALSSACGSALPKGGLPSGFDFFGQTEMYPHRVGIKAYPPNISIFIGARGILCPVLLGKVHLK